MGIKTILVYFSESKMFDNNCTNFSPNVTKSVMLIDNGAIDKSHDFGCYETDFDGKL